jgi:hypothetical protein
VTHNVHRATFNAPIAQLIERVVEAQRPQGQGLLGAPVLTLPGTAGFLRRSIPHSA